MKLKTLPPPAILAALQKSGKLNGKAEPFRISISSDINQLGRYSPQWVLADEQSVWVFDEASPDAPVHQIPLSEIEEFRTIAVVGSGLLQAKTAGMWLDLVRYSNRLKYHFGRASKRLEQLRQKETFEIVDEDETDPRRCAVSGILLEYPGQTSPFAVKRGRVFQRVVQLMRPYWGAAILMMGLLVLTLMVDLTMPQLTKVLIDGVIKQDTQVMAAFPLKHLDGIEPTRVLLIVVGILALLQITRALIVIANGRIGSRVATSITFDMRGRLVDHLEKLGLAYYDKQSTGSLVGRVSYDTEAVQGFVAQITGGFLFQILMVIMAAFAMFRLEWHLALWTLLPAPFVMAGTFFYYRWVYPHYERFWDRSSKQAGMINGILSGIRVVKAFAQEKREFDRFQNSSAILRDARRTLDASAATYYPIFSLIFSSGGWIVWYIGGDEVLHTRMTLGTLMAFFGYMGLFYAPLNNLTNLSGWLTSFSTQMHRIFEVLDTPITVPESGKPVSLPVMQGDIEFKNVTFGYSRQTPILKNVSFHIRPGEMIGVVGRSGSGKTTIINLISRFYDVDEGSIKIDGTDIRQVTHGDVRRQIGVVLQEPFLFRGTLWDNLTYGKTDATIEEGIAASRAGNAHDFIMKQMQAYDTWVGERGAGLSGGERQRLSIARALLCEPRILILDEATSSVDSESELAIQNALAELVKGRTSIVIAHRLSTLRNCNTIFVVDDGKIAESGSHAELMQLDGKYAKLVKIQGSASPTDSIEALQAKEAMAKDEAALAAIPPEQRQDPKTGLTPITGHRPRWLDPRFAHIHLGNRNALHVTIENERIYHGVFALRCMPVRFPNQFISLRWFNAENRDQEIGLIRDLSEWPVAVQQLVNESLLRRYFIHHILEIDSIKNEHNYLTFNAKTDLGPRQFVVRWAYETAHDYGPKGKVLVDTEENRYVVSDVNELPEASRKRFERYIYW